VSHQKLATKREALQIGLWLVLSNTVFEALMTHYSVGCLRHGGEVNEVKLLVGIPMFKHEAVVLA